MDLLMSTNDKAGSGEKQGYKPATEIEEAALHFHRYPFPGKLAVVPSKPASSQMNA